MLYNTLRQYEYLIAVAELRSLTEAARRLNVSQPSLSVAITRVEERLGRQVFVRRKGAPVEVTPYGHRVVARVRDLLALAEDIERRTGAPEPFTIACFEDLAPLHLAGALDRLQRHLPQAMFRGAEGRFAELAADLDQGRADIAISYDVGFREDFARHKLGSVAPVAFMAPDHPLAERPSLELGELAAYPLIFFAEELSEGFMNRLFRAMRLSPNVGHRVKSLEMMRSLAAHGAGVGLSYSCPPSDSCYDGRPVATVPVSTPRAKADMALIWSNLREQDALFRDVVRVLAGAYA